MTINLPLSDHKFEVSLEIVPIDKLLEQAHSNHIYFNPKPKKPANFPRASLLGRKKQAYRAPVNGGRDYHVMEWCQATRKHKARLVRVAPRRLGFG